jgi:hypothetical protein
VAFGLRAAAVFLAAIPEYCVILLSLLTSGSPVVVCWLACGPGFPAGLGRAAIVKTLPDLARPARGGS